MKSLYIDTSSSYLYSALIEDNVLKEEVKEEYGQSLSKVVLPKISEMFKKANWKPQDINKIYVVNGPGSFTGIRIGITIGKVYAWSLNIPITTILSLEAMALSTHNKTIHVPLIDARRGYVYSAIFDKDYNVLLKPQHITLDNLKKELEKYKEYEIITNDKFKDFNKIESYEPDIAKIVDFFKDKECINPHAVNPEYLKLTEAEEKKHDN